MLSKTTSLSTRSPTASLKKILKVVVMCWPKNLQKPSQEHQIEKSSKSAQRITREVPVWRHSDGGGWWVKVVLEINPHKTIASRYMRAKSLHKKIQKKRQKPRRPSEQSHALRFAKTTSPPKKKKPYKTPKNKTRRIRGLNTEMERRVRYLPLQIFGKPQKFHQPGRKPFQAVKKLPFLESPSPTTSTSSRSNRWQAVQTPFWSTNVNNTQTSSHYSFLMQILRLKLRCTKLIQQRWYFFLRKRSLKLPTAPELLWILGPRGEYSCSRILVHPEFCVHGSPRTGICHVSKLVGIVLLQFGPCFEGFSVDPLSLLSYCGLFGTLLKRPFACMPCSQLANGRERIIV